MLSDSPFCSFRSSYFWDCLIFLYHWRVTIYKYLIRSKAAAMRAGKMIGWDELLLNSREYVGGECLVTLLRPFSVIEFSSPSMSFDVVSLNLYTELVLMSCVGHDESTEVYGLIIFAGVPGTCSREKKTINLPVLKTRRRLNNLLD